MSRSVSKETHFNLGIPAATTEMQFDNWSLLTSSINNGSNQQKEDSSHSADRAALGHVRAESLLKI